MSITIISSYSLHWLFNCINFTNNKINIYKKVNVKFLCFFSPPLNIIIKLLFIFRVTNFYLNIFLNLINTISSNGIHSFWAKISTWVGILGTMFSLSEEKPSTLKWCEFNEFYMNHYTNQFTLLYLAISSIKKYIQFIMW